MIEPLFYAVGRPRRRWPPAPPLAGRTAVGWPPLAGRAAVGRPHRRGLPAAAVGRRPPPLAAHYNRAVKMELRGSLVDNLAAFVNRHRMFAPGARLGVAVSGGADSVGLLYLLLELAPAWRLALRMVHVNHGLRGEESDADARFVAGLAEQSQLPLDLERVEVAAVAGNLEQAGRDARRAVFHSLIRRGVVERVATGHTASDQAETVLYRLLRGSGTAGLAGILPVTAEGLVRPLLATERDEVIAWLGERGLGWREDSSNRDLAFARNRIRHQVLPALQQAAGPALVRTLARTAEVARDEELYWAARVAELAPALLSEEGGGALILEAERLAALEPALARRLVRHAIERVKGDLRGIGIAHVEGVLELAREPAGSGRLQVPGLDILRSFGWLRLGRLGEFDLGDRNYRIRVAPPGEFGLPGGGALRLSLAAAPPADGRAAIDFERVPGRLSIRNWRPGDEYQPAGRRRAERIKLLFQETRVPLWRRRHWPLVVAEDPAGAETILWSRAFGPAAACLPSSGSTSLLVIEEVGA